jgi:pimeloyl-ACP methyl ester carboxylesterase
MVDHSPVADADAIRLHCEVRGQGRPLLLILGLGGDISEYTALIDELAQTRQVIAFDNRGAGRSEKPDVPYSIELMAADTARLVRGLDIPRLSVLGISLGGRIAMELTIGHPDLVDRLILVSTSPRVIPSWRRRWLWPLLAGMHLRSRYPQPRYAFMRQLRASTGYDATPRLREIAVPTLILHGRRDRTAPLYVAEEMHQAIPGSEMLTFPGGHLFFLLRGRRHFVEGVRRFLDA